MTRLGTALILAALGSSTIAMADDHHWGDRDDRYGHRYDRYDHHDRDDYDHVARDRWQTFATHVRLDGHRAIRLNMQGARLHSVEVQALRGGAHIDSIGVIYMNHRQEPFVLYRDIDARRAPNLRVDLSRDGMEAGVEAVVVDGTGDLAFRVIGG